jgi:hypothetical protein
MLRYLESVSPRLRARIELARVESMNSVEDEETDWSTVYMKPLLAGADACATAAQAARSAADLMMRVCEDLAVEMRVVEDLDKL